MQRKSDVERELDRLRFLSEEIDGDRDKEHWAALQGARTALLWVLEKSAGPTDKLEDALEGELPKGTEL